MVESDSVVSMTQWSQAPKGAGHIGVRFCGKQDTVESALNLT